MDAKTSHFLWGKMTGGGMGREQSYLVAYTTLFTSCLDFSGRKCLLTSAITQENESWSQRGTEIQRELVGMRCGSFNSRAKGIFSKEIKEDIITSG